MNTRMVNTAADVISRAMQKGRTLPAALAVALDSAQLLQSPETAAEHERVRTKYLEAAATVAQLVLERGQRMKVENAVRAELHEAQARVAELEARLAEHEQSPLAWARLLDAKSLDNFLTALSMAADTDPQDGALAQVEEMIRSFRAALPDGAQERRARTLHDHIVARDAEIERLRARLAEYERPADEDPIAYALTDQADGITRQIAPVQALREDSQNGGAC